jgi:hypothetical protein
MCLDCQPTFRFCQFSRALSGGKSVVTRGG